jgi:ferredoxin
MIPQETAAAVMCSNTDKGADARKACKNACIGCMKCKKVCPHDAITVTNNLAKIDYDKCEGCGACAEVCPTGCMKQVVFPDIPEDVHPNDLIDKSFVQ